jgi:hypothetical protein
VNYAFRTGGVDGTWTDQGVVPNSPVAWGRPSVIASGATLDIAMLRDDADANGTRSIWRVSFLNIGGVLHSDDSWNPDSSGWRSLSPPDMYALTTSTIAAILMVMRGYPNNKEFQKYVTQFSR